MGIITCRILAPSMQHSLQSPSSNGFLGLGVDPIIFLALSKQRITAGFARLHQNKGAVALLTPLLFILRPAAGGLAVFSFLLGTQG